MKKLLLILSLGIIIFYAFFLYILPSLVNSVRINSFLERKTFEKTGIEIKTNNLKLKTKANLTANLLADKIEINKDNAKLFDAKNINIIFSPLFSNIKDIRIRYIFIDNNGMKELVKNRKSKNHKKYKLNNLPEIYIDKTEILVKYNENKKALITFNNIDTDKYEDKPNTISFDSIIESPFINDDITIKSNKSLKYTDRTFVFENININVGKSKLIVDGKIKKGKFDINVTGKDIPVYDIENYILYYLKLKNPKKNFLENFYDFSGNADINLKFSNNGVDGTVLMKALAAKTVFHDVPIKLKDFTGYFEGDEIKAEAYGKLGYEDVYTNFSLSHYDKERRSINGRVHSNLTNRTIKEYLPIFNVIGSADATVAYKIEHSIPNIVYEVKLDEGSSIEYKNASLGLTDKNRILFIKTKKEADKLYIEDYEYSINVNGNRIKIITGKGLFEKINGKMTPSYIEAKTEAPTPVSVTGSFGRRLNGGNFEGNLKYDYIKHLLTGNFNLSDSEYKNFKIKTADITANEKIFEVSSNGTFDNSQYKCYINMDNRFRDLIKIHNIDLFLDKFVTKNSTQNTNNIQNFKNSKIIKEVKKLDYIIENGKIQLNKVKHRDIIVENIIVYGSLANNVIKFRTDDAHFAKGKLKIDGTYNISNKNAVVDFTADNIDSDNAASMIFNLHNQIEGTARANLKAKLNIKTHTIDADTTFAIKNGYLPKLGSTEFMLKKSRKNDKTFGIKLSKIINIDISNEKPMMSDINGSMKIKNRDLENINLFSKNPHLSMFIEGNYDIDKEKADVKIWGKYDKNERNKIRVLYIPLSAIMKVIFKDEHSADLYKDKIKKIPSISATADDTEIFSVKLKGNPNNNKVKVELRSIK